MKHTDITEAICAALKAKQLPYTEPWTSGACAPGAPETELDKAISAYCAAEGITYAEGPGDASYYDPVNDLIELPARERFISPAHYAATKAHEATHSAGVYVRCNRDMTGVFGSYRYAREELTADLGAMFLLNDFGLLTEDVLNNTRAYIQSWARPLQLNPRWVREAAELAEEAEEFILQYS